jgi:hypothetical protein
MLEDVRLQNGNIIAHAAVHHDVSGADAFIPPPLQGIRGARENCRSGPAIYKVRVGPPMEAARRVRSNVSAMF